MLKKGIIEKELGGTVKYVSEEVRLYKTYALYNQEAVVEFSDKGIALYEDFESDDDGFLTLPQWENQYDNSLERDLKAFLYYVEDGKEAKLVREEIVSEKVFKDMMQTLMLWKAYRESVNQYHWLKLLLERTKQMVPKEEEETSRLSLEDKMKRYLPEWEDVYTGGNIYEMHREFTDKQGKPLLVVLTEMGANLYKEGEESARFLSAKEYDKLQWEVLSAPLVYEAGDEVNAYDVFNALDAKEIEAADKLYQLITD